VQVFQDSAIGVMSLFQYLLVSQAKVCSKYTVGILFRMSKDSI
jgi:hypothetical protein